MIEFDLASCCYACKFADIDCDYIETNTADGVFDRSYTIRCTKADVCKFREMEELKGDEEDHEWWK